MVAMARANRWQNGSNRFLWPWFIKDQLENILRSFTVERGKDFGNSTGDYSMLNYAKGNPEHPGMGVFIVCDDAEREYGSDEKAAGFYSEAEKQGWNPVSMKNDWKTIYGEDVIRTELPGTEEVLPDAA